MDNKNTQPAPPGKNTKGPEYVVIQSIADPQAMRATQQQNVAAPVPVTAPQPTPPNVQQNPAPQVQITSAPTTSTPVVLSANSQSLRTYNKKMSFERVMIAAIILAIIILIYYFGFYHPIGIYTYLVNLINDVKTI